MLKGKKSKYIPGIYNYCDRWCERCDLTSRCLLFSRDSKRRADHIARGEDPDDLKTVMDDVQSDLRESLEMIQKDASDLGINLNQITEKERRQVKEFSHPLHSKAEGLSFNIHQFRKKATNLFLDESSNDSDKKVQSDSLDVLAWYEFQFSVKLKRALQSIEEHSSDAAAAADDDLFDAKASAKVAWIGLTKSLDALTILDHFLPGLHSDTLQLIQGIHEVILLLDETIPGHKTVQRPGFEIPM
jgi:hypothetical protein